MQQNKKKTQAAAVFLQVLAGNILYALTARVFLIPSGLITGGTTGIALALEHYFGLNVSLSVFVFGLAMLLLGWRFLGRSFALSTIVSTFAYPLALRLLELWLGDVQLTDDLFLNTVFSGFGIGLSLSIIIRAGASSGGMDIPPLLLEKYCKIPVSVSLYVFDLVILLLQMGYNRPDMILYGIVLVLIYSLALDQLLLMGTAKTEVKVVSRKAAAVRDMVLYEMDRGVTLLHAESGYLHKDTELVMSVISRRELPRLEKKIRAIDPESFIIVSRVSEVRGRGFSMDKVYR